MGVTRDLLAKIWRPVLILQSVENHVVPPTNGEFIRDQIGSKDCELMWLKNSYHVVTMDSDKDIIVEKTLGFIQACLAKSGS